MAVVKRVNGFKVERGVPLPEKYGKGQSKYPFMDLKPGLSFLVPCPKPKQASRLNAMHNCLSSLRKSNPPCKKWVFTMRQVEGGVRVWRLK